VLGPIEAALPRVAKHFRWQILLKGLKVGPLHRFLQQLLFTNRAKISNRSIKVIADVDPFFMM
jgi:primosomal protein N'